MESLIPTADLVNLTVNTIANLNAILTQIDDFFYLSFFFFNLTPIIEFTANLTEKSITLYRTYCKSYHKSNINY